LLHRELTGCPEWAILELSKRASSTRSRS
jgi:hypothetical protein